MASLVVAADSVAVGAEGEMRGVVTIAAAGVAASVGRVNGGRVHWRRVLHDQHQAGQRMGGHSNLTGTRSQIVLHQLVF